MKTHLLFLLSLLFCSGSLYAQGGITFKVEKLSKPEFLLPLSSYDDICKKLILADLDLSLYELKKGEIDIPLPIIAKSEVPDSLISFRKNSFFHGMYHAYAYHRPFVLSPDMIWLLISQGFARHVNANSEAMRGKFVEFSGRQSLIVQANRKLEELSWDEILPQFTRQIEQQVGNRLAEVLTCDFSTTTSVEKIASEITIMEAVKPYFEFIVMRIVCGIPKITLEGTPEDWEKVLVKAKALKSYELDWWISELEPLLKEFVKASKGKVDKEFWRNMFKYHSPKKYGAPNIIDGWIVKFFPYDNKGKRNNLKELVGTDSLPDEIVKVDLNYEEVYGDTIVRTPLELWAGFVGLQQNSRNFTLKPQIGWMIKKKDISNAGLKEKLIADARKPFGIHISVKEFPAILLELKSIGHLEINFTDDIRIPDELSKVQIGTLVLTGRINEAGVKRIKKMFPCAKVTINGK